VKLDHIPIRQNPEQESFSIELQRVETATFFVRDGAIHTENVAVLRFADRYSRALLCTEIVKLLSGEVVL
jgi:hypothetical protein